MLGQYGHEYTQSFIHQILVAYMNASVDSFCHNQKKCGTERVKFKSSKMRTQVLLQVQVWAVITQVWYIAYDDACCTELGC